MTPGANSDRLGAAVDAFRRMAVPDPPVVLVTARLDRRWQWACVALAFVQCLTLAGWALDNHADTGRQDARPSAARSEPAPKPDLPVNAPQLAPPVVLLDDPDRLPPLPPESRPLAAYITTAGSYRTLGLD